MLTKQQLIDVGYPDTLKMAADLLALRARNEKLEVALRKCRPLIGCFPSQSAADLVEEVEQLIGKYDWFAQPAESVATETKEDAALKLDAAIAERDSARALLREVERALEHPVWLVGALAYRRALSARISKELGQ